MKKFFPLMIDCPEKKSITASLSFGAFSFLVFPFVLLMLSIGTRDQMVKSWMDIVYHAINFIAAVGFFWSYLGESFFNVQMNVKKFAAVVGICVGLILAYSIVVFCLGFSADSRIEQIAANGTLPLVEVELFHVTNNLIKVNPIFGTLCVVLLTPVTISCMYYACGFAPICSERPWLAYIVVAILLAVPRACNVFSFWPWKEELALYLVQLPIHLIACVAYQKTDTVWAPIAVHMIANILSSAAFFLLFAMM